MWVPIDAFIQDRDYRLARRLSGYNPSGFHLDHFLETLDALAAGVRTFIPHYSHTSGTRCANPTCDAHDHWLPATDTPVIVEGAFLWHDDIRSRVTRAAFFDFANADDYWRWRLRHEQEQRGFSRKDALNHMRLLQLDSEFIDRSSPFCDERMSVLLPHFVYAIEAPSWTT